MQIRYFQALHDCFRTLEKIHLPSHGFIQDKTLASSFKSMSQPSEEEIQLEIDAIKFVAGLYKGFVRSPYSIKRPSNELITSAFNRIIEIADIVHDTQRNSKNKNPLVQKEVACAYYYIFQFTKEAWVDKLPEELISEQQYSEDLRKRISDRKIKIK